MKAIFAIAVIFAVGAAKAHDSLVPHTHPHGVSMLPDVETLGVAALVLALAIIAFARFKNR